MTGEATKRREVIRGEWRGASGYLENNSYGRRVERCRGLLGGQQLWHES